VLIVSRFNSEAGIAFLLGIGFFLYGNKVLKEIELHNRIAVATMATVILLLFTVFMLVPVLCSKYQIMFA